MANNNNIQNFTAVDIEKYHKGLLSSTQMNAMEKAALDDPFLADAMEGYSVAGVNAAAYIAELKKRLGEKVEEERKVIPLRSATGSSFRMWKAAAVIIFIAGAGLLVFQMGFNKNKADIAQAEVKTETITKANDSVAQVSQNSDNATATPQTNGNITSSDTKTTSPTNGTISVVADEQTNSPVVKNKEVNGEITSGKATDGFVTIPKTTERRDQPVASVPAGTADLYKKRQDSVSFKREGANEYAKNNGAGVKPEATDKDVAIKQADDANYNHSVAAGNNRSNEQIYRNQQNNIFRGRVTDVSNVGVPFANVTNVQDNAGTYTDANGNFILTSPDSILSVQVRSIGFENNNIQLRNSQATNQVIMQDDRKSLSEVVLSSQKPNTVARSRKVDVKVEEPVPIDGWDNYDAYLANNIDLPDDYKSRQTDDAAVEISFEVDKNGEPVNIKVERSLSATCDKEAIRLVKEGPKWKRKAKNGRTTVTIPFHSSF